MGLMIIFVVSIVIYDFPIKAKAIDTCSENHSRNSENTVLRKQILHIAISWFFTSWFFTSWFPAPKSSWFSWLLDMLLFLGHHNLDRKY